MKAKPANSKEGHNANPGTDLGRNHRPTGACPWRGLASASWVGVIVVMSLLIGTLPARASAASAAAEVTRPPRLRPDYSGLVIPPNIAPLNFVVEEPATRHRVRFRGDRGTPIEVDGGPDGVIDIPLRPWRALLATNVGGPLYFEVTLEDPAGTWTRFAPVTNRIATETIDPTIAYRLLNPLYSYYAELGIYQRDLESHRQTTILENRDFGSGCLNCHTFLNRQPETFALHIRGQKGPQPMLLVRSNEVSRVDKTAGYLSWHPSGRLLAYSANQLSLFFHTAGETRDVFDAESNLGIYWVESNLVETPPAVTLPDRLENWPSWSPDGRHLYFTSARKLRWERFRQIRYDLMRVSFDLDRNAWGEPETLVSGDEVGLSASQPRVSPDGRWLLFCLAKYGHFPIYQPGSDLYLMDLLTKKWRRLDINSDQADSWHCWASNGRWVVFSSKRVDGLLARPHFSYVDEAGRFHKPFILPQGDPTFYDSCLQTFNLPEFVLGPVRVGAAELARGVIRPRTSLTPADPTRQEHHEEQNTPAPSDK